MDIVRAAARTVFTAIAVRTVGHYDAKPKVNFYSRFTKNTSLGRNTNFNGLTIRGQGNVVIGDNFHSGKGCLLINSHHQYDSGNAIPYDTEKVLDLPIVIGDNVWLGDRVLVLGGVTIGEGAVIQAGAVVVSDIGDYGVAGGNPAKVFKTRDIAHYEKLKSGNRFC